jgi:hypothetical protein
VTKTTTCDDVIQYLLNANGLIKNTKDYYFLIASNNRTEKKLSKNANILTVAKDLMSQTKKIHFIMRKKTRLFVPKISIAKSRRLREKSLIKEQKVEKVPSTLLDTSKCAPSMKTNEQIRGITRLYQLVQVQKRRLSEVYQKCNGNSKFFKQTITKKTIHSNADTSLDQFLKDVNTENIQGFLNFCDVVATKEMENLSSILPRVPTVERSVINGHLRIMPHTLESSLVDYTSRIPMVNDTNPSELNSAFKDVTNDDLMLDDELIHRRAGEQRFGTMNMSSSRRRTIPDPSRMKRNNTPLHSTPLAKKTMTYLNKSMKPTIMMRQFGSSRLPQDRLTNLTPKKLPKRDSTLNGRPDGDLSMFIWHGRSAFSSQNDKCKNFWEQSYGSDSDDNLDTVRPDKKHEDSVVNHADDNRNVSADLFSSVNVLSRKLANERDHLEFNFDSSSREFPRENHQRDQEHDGSIKSNLKMKLVNYSLSDGDISSISCRSLGMSCDCKKIPCATFTRDYVTRFGYSPESA